jgi:Tol biopolymer transport system component
MNEGQPRYSPDGRYVAFTSDRSGASEVWMADADGSSPRQLTHLGAYIAGFPRWSPDGKRIVFHARLPDIAQLYLVDVDAGVPRRLTNSATGFTGPSWSSDGKHVYAQGAYSEGRVYRIKVDDGSEEPLFEGRQPLETPDGKLLLYSKRSPLGIFARSLEADAARNPERRLVDDYTVIGAGFLPVADGFYYAGSSPSGIPRALRFFDYALGKAKDIALAPQSIDVLTISPDRRRLLYSAREEASGYDLLMLEFHAAGDIRH